MNTHWRRGLSGSTDTEGNKKQLYGSSGRLIDVSLICATMWDNQSWWSRKLIIINLIIIEHEFHNSNKCQLKYWWRLFAECFQAPILRSKYWAAVVRLMLKQVQLSEKVYSELNTQLRHTSILPIQISHFFWSRTLFSTLFCSLLQLSSLVMRKKISLILPFTTSGK